MNVSEYLTTATKAVVLSAALMGLAACGDDVPIGGDDGGRDTDAGRRVDAGGGGELCGPVICGAGTSCCDATCGLCTPDGTACPLDTCVDGGGPCIECAAPPDGCEYVGGSCTTCGDLVCGYDCGGLLGSTCDDDEYCDYDALCGGDDSPGTCQPRPEACDPECPGVCGCDGNTYCSACVAAAAGVDVASAGVCDPSGPCDPFVARAEGPCDAELGVLWNGTACVTISGCSCVGADCGRLYTTEEECQTAHAGCGATCGTIAGLPCPSGQFCDYAAAMCGVADAAGTCRPRPTACPDVFAPVCGCDGVTYDNECYAHGAEVSVLHTGSCETTPCAPMMARGEGDCALFLGYSFNGAACVGIGGCSCVGADCGSLFPSPEACEAAYASCLMPPPPSP